MRASTGPPTLHRRPRHSYPRDGTKTAEVLGWSLRDHLWLKHRQHSKSEWVEGMVRRLQTLLILVLMLACSVLLTMGCEEGDSAGPVVNNSGDNNALDTPPVVDSGCATSCSRATPDPARWLAGQVSAPTPPTLRSEAYFRLRAVDLDKASV